MLEVPKSDPIQGAILHEYDGILEADNELPRWWLYALYCSVLFAAGYWFYYEEFKVSPGPTAAYFVEKAKLAEQTGADPTDVELMALLGTDALSKGAATFATNCVACHEAQGQGKIGPNLTDAAWLHGGGPLAIFKTVRDGVAAKGMPAWGPVLGRGGVLQVTAFVLSLRDKNVPGKPAEGETYAAGMPSTPEQ